jgi:DNA-binding transcriptional MerR regulator/effector-binding domain-containing protein
MRPGLSIGEFATVTHLSIRTLRRYHEAGLLEPDHVDPQTGYRYYTAAQIPPAQVIHRLRELDVPLAEVKAILATEDPRRRNELIGGHLRRLEESLDRTRAAVSSLRELLQPTADELPARMSTAPPRTVAAISAHVGHGEVVAWYAAAMKDLNAAVPPDKRTGPAAGHYANELFTAGEGTATVFYPVQGFEPADGGRVELLELPATELAVVEHLGPHDDIDVTYGRLGAWVTGHAMAVDGPIQETYLVGPADTPDPGRWRTEIGWPVFRLTAG